MLGDIYIHPETWGGTNQVLDIYQKPMFWASAESNEDAHPPQDKDPALSPKLQDSNADPLKPWTLDIFHCFRGGR